VAGLCACTLIVDHEISPRPPPPPPPPPDAGPCGEEIFLNGSPNDAGEYFHGGVTKASWHGPAFPREGFDPSGHGAVMAFLHDGGVAAGAPGTQGAAMGWAPLADGGGAIATLWGNHAETCDEVFPLACVPPLAATLPPTGPRRVEGFIGAGEQPVWIVSSFA